MANVEAKHETVFDAGTAQARLARVYAESLMQAALHVSEQAALDVGEEMRKLRLGLIEHPEVAEFLSSPALGKNGKLTFIEEALTGNASHLLRGLVHALWQNNRLRLLRNVVAAYLRLLDERAGRVPVTVTSAIPLSEAEHERLVATLRQALGREPIVTARVDPDLLGGLLVKVGDTVIDTSVRSRLQSLRTLLLAR
jgi:F-type H+-transporting ATPase subunit delta